MTGLINDVLFSLRAKSSNDLVLEKRNLCTIIPPSVYAPTLMPAPFSRATLGGMVSGTRILNGKFLWKEELCLGVFKEVGEDYTDRG